MLRRSAVTAKSGPSWYVDLQSNSVVVPAADPAAAVLVSSHESAGVVMPSGREQWTDERASDVERGRGADAPRHPGRTGGRGATGRRRFAAVGAAGRRRGS